MRFGMWKKIIIQLFLILIISSCQPTNSINDPKIKQLNESSNDSSQNESQTASSSGEFTKGNSKYLLMMESQNAIRIAAAGDWSDKWGKGNDTHDSLAMAKNSD
jgi:hypothetical protein